MVTLRLGRVDHIIAAVGLGAALHFILETIVAGGASMIACGWGVGTAVLFSFVHQNAVNNPEH